MKNLYKILSFIGLLSFTVQMAYAQGMIIPSGAYVIAPVGSTVVMKHNFENNGTFTHNGTLYFSGTTQAINGSTATTFNNITVSSGSTTTINAANQKLNAVLLCDGTLNSGGNLTLTSGSSQTALIDGAGTGDVLGDVIVQRYLSAGNGYKYVSSPFQSATVNEFADDVDLNASFPTFYWYDENETSAGWEIYTGTSNALTPVQGYAANFGAVTTSKTIDATGVVNNGTQSAATLYNHNQVYTQGFNLVGNPYPSPIDWEAVTGWTRTNIDDAIYFFNTSGFQYTGHYSSYINGVSSDGIASGTIPAMQGFFVHVSDGSYPVSATFSMNNSVRIKDLAPTYHKGTAPEIPLLRLIAEYADDSIVSDAVVVYFEPKATTAFDKQFDALKILNTDEHLPNIYVISPNADRLSISAMSDPADSISTIPLGVDVSKSGWVVFNTSVLEYMPYGMHAYLADQKAKTIQELQMHKESRVLLDSGKYENRFSIIFSKKEISSGIINFNGLNAYSNGSKIIVNLNLTTGASGDMVVRNVLGQQIYRTSLEGYGDHQIELPGIDGVYVLSFYSDNGVFSKRLFLSAYK